MSIGKTPKEIVSFIATQKVEVVDLRFMDFPGLWQHFSIPARELTEEVFEKGLGFRRLQHPRMAGHQRIGHAGEAGRRHGVRRSVPRGKDAGGDLQHLRPAHR